jgi:hypothetical protein
VYLQLKTGVSKDETGRPAYYLRRALLNPGTEYVFEIKPGVQASALSMYKLSSSIPRAILKAEALLA